MNWLVMGLLSGATVRLSLRETKDKAIEMQLDRLEKDMLKVENE